VCILVKLCEQNTFALKAFFDIPSAKNMGNEKKYIKIEKNWPEK
jgi:hypothetical protein